jgi:hypothetical protein
VAEALESLQESINILRLEVRALTDENKTNKSLLAAIADRNSIYMDDITDSI